MRNTSIGKIGDDDRSHEIILETGRKIKIKREAIPPFS